MPFISNNRLSVPDVLSKYFNTIVMFRPHDWEQLQVNGSSSFRCYCHHIVRGLSGK